MKTISESIDNWPDFWYEMDESSDLNCINSPFDIELFRSGLRRLNQTA